MSSSEVKEIMHRAWQTNAPMLGRLYGQGSPSIKSMRTLVQHRGKAPAALREEVFQRQHAMFFVGMLPVAPNRVRPLQYVNGAAYDHPHNVALAKVRLR